MRKKETDGRFRKRMQRGYRESVLLRSFTCYSHVNQRFLDGSFGGRDSDAERARIRRACLRARERSIFFSWSRRIGIFLLDGSLSSLGSLCLFSAAFAILGRLALGTFSVFDTEAIVSFVLLASSVFLLHSKQSLSNAIGNSAFFDWLLFDVCRFPRDRLVSEWGKGEDRRWTALICSVLLGALASVVHPIWIVFAVVCMFLFTLVQAVPEILFISVLFLLPFFNLFSHPTAVLTLVVGIGEVFWFGKTICGHRDFRFGVLSFFVLLFGIFLFLGGVFGAGGVKSFGRAVMMLVLLLSYFPFCGVLSQPVWRKRAMLSLCLSALIVSSIGIVQYFFTDLELKWVDVARFSDIGGRVTSLFANPNVLAEYLLLTLSVMLGEGMDARHSARIRFLFWMTVLSEFGCLILTWSRGAWLGAIASTFLFLLLYSKQSRRILLWVLVPVLIWIPLLPHSIVNRFSSIGVLTESSIRYRLYTWQGTLRMLMAHPFGIGIGEEAFFKIYPSFAVSGTETVMHTHQLFLQILTELGIFGLICFLAVLFLFTQAVLFVYRECGERDGSKQLLGGFCAIFGALVMGLFDYVWYHCGIFWLFWVIFAQAATLAESKIRKTEEETRWMLA